MAIIALFEVKGNTASKYDDVVRRLTEIGLRVPKGQLYHVCYGDRQNLQVINVFESRADLDAFAAKLVPIIASVGVEAKPTVYEVYNVIDG